VFKQNN
jgi:hypothetical protein